MTTTAARPAATVTRARTAVMAVFLLNGLVMASWISRVPATRDRLDLSASQIGLVLLAMSGGAVLALPLAGTVVHRFGPRGTVRAAALLCTAGLALFGLAPSVWLLVPGLFCMGVGSGTWDVAMNVEGAEVERRLGRAIMPHFHALFSVGTVVGALLGALLNHLDVPTPAHLVPLAVLVAVATLWSLRGFLPDAEVPDEHADDAATSGPRMRAIDAWREPRTLAIGLVVLTFAFTEGSANDWMALALVDGYDLSNSQGVLGFAVFVTAMTVGRLLGTRLLDRFGRVPVLRLTAALAVVGLLLVVVGVSPWLAGVGAVLWGLGASLGFPVGMSAAADDPRYAAARVSVVSSIGYTAFLAGPPLIGFLADHVGILEALWVVLAVLAVAVVVAQAAREQPPAGS
ncbi:MFS transporter [Angustibacter aerolatus]|uniref:MFS transporter n=1 Tax=Angustibacter aerolatus TaxID=1162965 RepID=A0ABQ6JKR4_9ACTN|nr:MFS transporter [Angustibacter aerolatus]GMA87993.1 MFS transporter [Angustibacter aerolatus]